MKFNSMDAADNLIFYLSIFFAFSLTLSKEVTHWIKILLYLTILYRFIKFKTNGLNFSQYKKYMSGIGCFFIAIFLSSVFGDDWSTSLRHDFRSIVEKSLFFFIPLVFLKNLRQIQILFLSLFLALAISDLYAVWQGLNGAVRVAGFRGNVMWFASYLVILVPALWIYVLNLLKWESLYLKIFYCSVLFFSVPAVFYNATRGVWLALAVLLPLLTIVVCRNNWRKMCGILACIVILFCGMYTSSDYFSQRVESISVHHSSNAERFLLWKSSMDMMRDYPVFGVGLGHFSKYYHEQYISPQAKEPNLEHAHNVFFHIGAENGFIGLIAFCVMFGVFFIQLWHKWKKCSTIYALMGIASTAGFLLQGLTEYNFTSTASITLYWLVLGLCVRGSDLEEGNV